MGIKTPLMNMSGNFIKELIICEYCGATLAWSAPRERQTMRLVLESHPYHCQSYKSILMNLSDFIVLRSLYLVNDQLSRLESFLEFSGVLLIVQKG